MKHCTATKEMGRTWNLDPTIRMGLNVPYNKHL